MERFEKGTTVRLKGSHGKYLWAGEDEYDVSQHVEGKNEKALWRVERVGSRSGNRVQSLRLKSCFDAYLTACDYHHHGLSILGFCGERVAQMRPENVDSTLGFDWEPVIEGGQLKLKSCYGTFLRANSCKPPWHDSVSHDNPRHQEHQHWLVWEVETVHAPHVIPLELVLGPLDKVDVQQVPLEGKPAKRETIAHSRLKVSSRA